MFSFFQCKLALMMEVSSRTVGAIAAVIVEEILADSSVGARCIERALNGILLAKLSSQPFK